MNKSFSVGLDIGTTRLLLWLVKKSVQQDKCTWSRKISKSWSSSWCCNNITQTIQSIKIAIEEAQNKSNIEISEVAGHCRTTY